jgi:hypothetical protein
MPKTVSASEGLRSDDRIGSMWVVDSSEDRLELKSRLRSIILWFSIAGLCALIAAHGWWSLIFVEGYHVNLKFLLLLTFAAIICSILGSMHVGLRTIVDRQRRAVTVTRLFGAFQKVVEAQSCRAVRLKFIPGGTGNSDDCHLELVSPSGERAHLITGRRIDKCDSANLVAAAQQLTSILKLPLEIEGESQKGCKAFTDALSRVSVPR